MKRSLSSLVVHHDALRSIFRETSFFWDQEYLDLDGNYYDLLEYDLSLDTDWESSLWSYSSDLQSSINISEGPLFKVGLFRCKDGDRLLLVIHHLIVDGVSWRILLEDLSGLYDHYCNGVSFSLGAKTDSFASWTRALQSYAESHILLSEGPYWSDVVCREVDTVVGLSLIHI